MAFVVVGHRLTATFFQRKARLSAVKRLNLGLLVQRQHERMLWRVEVETDHVLQLFGKARVVAQLESLDSMRPEAVLAPDAAHGGFAHPTRPGHAPGAPLRSLRRSLLGGPPDDLLDRFRRQGRLAPRARGVSFNARHALLEKAESPSGDGGRSRGQRLSNLLVLPSLRSQQHHLGSLADPDWNASPARLLSQHGMLGLGQRNRGSHSQGVHPSLNGSLAPLNYTISDALHWLLRPSCRTCRKSWR